MGWLFHYSRSWTAKDQMDDLERQLRESKYSDVIMTRRSFGRFWALLRDKRTGHDTIFLALVKGPNKDMGAGYKDMDENWGPYEVDCPLSILDNARAPESKNAYEWRQACRRHHEAKKARRSELKPGLLVEYGGHKYRLGSKSTTKRGAWNVDMVLDNGCLGMTYRMKASQLLAAKLVAAPA